MPTIHNNNWLSPDEYLNAAQLAELLGCKRSRIDNWRDSGFFLRPVRGRIAGVSKRTEWCYDMEDAVRAEQALSDLKKGRKLPDLRNRRSSARNETPEAATARARASDAPAQPAGMICKVTFWKKDAAENDLRATIQGDLEVGMSLARSKFQSDQAHLAALSGGEFKEYEIRDDSHATH